ncbi:MAG: cyanophycinase [Planctomycetota bacterium]|nr:cyanophycinase [Planctomycetota bacterium]
MRQLLLLTTAFLLNAVTSFAAEISPERFDSAGIKGTLFLCGGGRLPDEVRDAFVEAGGGEKCRLVIIPTATVGEESDALQEGAEIAELWRVRSPASIEILHTRDRAVANDPKFSEPLKTATAVWFAGGRQSQIAGAYSGTVVEQELRNLLDRGGVVGGTSAGAACMSRVMIVRGKIHETPGLGLLPGAIVDQHFLARDRRDRLMEALAAHPALVGVGIDEGTALIVRGRELKCLGDSSVHLCLGVCGPHPPLERVLKSGDVSDLTMFRRGALARTEPPFPPTEIAAPVVPTGALVIVGGGGMSKEIVERFIELAGGVDAPIVVLPTANPEPDANEGRFFERAGAKNVKSLTARGKTEVETPETLEVLRQAKGVWFGGGRQWRFVDAYENTQAVELFHDVLKRGGVIGGSSAGATIQGDYLVRGSPLGNTDMMALGYERGFAFLPGTAIDQHFSQRKRFGDMTRVVERHPQLLGIGLDEATAIIVRGSVAEVMGAHRVHFYDRAKPAVDERDYESVAPGGKYELKKREVIDAD